MPVYPDNSHSAKEAAVKSDSEKKLKKVVSGEAKTRKKSEVKKFANIFVPDDVSSIKEFILKDVIIPGIRNALADATSIILFGETGHISGKKANGSKVPYQRYYDDKREYARPRTSGGFEYDDIIFTTRADAELVLDQLDSAIASYGVVSVLDLYDLAGITCQNGYTAKNYGWTDIRNAKVVRIRDGYILQLPRTVQIT